MNSYYITTDLIVQKLGGGHSMARRIIKKGNCKGIHAYDEKSSPRSCKESNIEAFKPDSERG